MDIRSDRQKVISYLELGKKYHIDLSSERVSQLWRLPGGDAVR